MTFDVNKLIEEIERLSASEISYIDTIAHIADIHGIEIEVIAKIINSNKLLKAKIYEDSEKYRLVEKNESLEFR